MDIDYSALFLHCVKIGDIEKCKQMKWLYNIEIEQFHINCSCKQGNLEMLQWLCDNIYCMSKYYQRCAFVDCCHYNHLHIVKWLYEKSPNIVIDSKNIIDVDPDRCIIYILLTLSKKGYIEICEWLLNKNFITHDNTDLSDPLNISSLYTNVKTGSTLCILFDNWINDSNLEMCKILLKRYPDFDIEYEKLFYICCENGYDIILTYFHDQLPYNIDIDYEKLFHICCKNGHAKVSELLYKIKPKLIFCINIKMLHDSCINNHIVMSKWLYEKHDVLHKVLYMEHILIDIPDYIFEICYEKRYYIMCNWLTGINPRFTLLYINNKIIPITNRVNECEVEDYYICLEDCCVCLEDNNYVLQCKHSICIDCIVKMNNYTCPLCRIPYTMMFKL
jgi:hypothetical protein